MRVERREGVRAPEPRQHRRIVAARAERGLEPRVAVPGHPRLHRAHGAGDAARVALHRDELLPRVAGAALGDLGLALHGGEGARAPPPSGQRARAPPAEPSGAEQAGLGGGEERPAARRRLAPRTSPRRKLHDRRGRAGLWMEWLDADPRRAGGVGVDRLASSFMTGGAPRVYAHVPAGPRGRARRGAGARGGEAAGTRPAGRLRSGRTRRSDRARRGRRRRRRCGPRGDLGLERRGPRDPAGADERRHGGAHRSYRARPVPSRSRDARRHRRDGARVRRRCRRRRQVTSPSR